jgi:hypothetical protein
LCVFLAAAFLLFHNVWSKPASQLNGGAGDSILFTWFLRWTPFALSHGHNPIVSHYINYPDGVNLTWNTWVPAPAVLLWPVTAAVGPVVAYNLFVTLALALSGLCAFLALRRFTSSTSGAFLGAVLYGFSPYMIAHSGGHPDLTFAVTPPLMVVVLDEILIRQRLAAATAGFLLGLLAALQFFISEEILASEVIAGVVGLALLATLFRSKITRPRIAYSAKALSLAVVVAVIPTIGLLGVQFFGPDRPHGAVQQPNVYVTDVLNFVLPIRNVQLFTPNWALKTSDHFSGNGAEQTAYLGAPLIALLLFSVVLLWRRPIVRFSFAFGIAMAILSLGSTLHVGGRVIGRIHLPSEVLAHTPLLDNVIPGRFTLYMFLFAGVLVALFVEWLSRERGRALVVGGIGLSGVAATLFPTIAFGAASVDSPAFFNPDTIGKSITPGAVALVVPFTDGAVNDAPMLWQAQANMAFQMPDGYFIGPARTSVGTFGPVPSQMSTVIKRVEAGSDVSLTPEIRRALISDLTRWHIGYVVVGPDVRRDAFVGLFNALLSPSAPTQEGGVYIWQLGSP